MTNLTVPNQPPVELAQDFYALREEALTTLQRLAGDTWTDHNLHDPGITLLETLCYVLTDLGYRLDFPIEDLIAKASDREPEAFPQPAAMLDCHPVTEDDYRRLILDVPGVRNALLAQREPGLWHIQVIPDSQLNDEQQRQLAQQVRTAFLAHRNLGEDLQQLELTETYDAVLKINIDLNSQADPVETLAQIYNGLANIIAPRVRFYALAELELAGHQRETLNTGPWLKRGYLPDSELERPALVERIFVSDLINQVLTHGGVNELNELKIASTSEPSEADFEDWVYSPITDMVPVLDIESTLNFLTVSKEGTPINIPRERLIERFLQLRFGQPDPGRDSSWHGPGRYRHPGNYLSLQQELPSIYGVGPQGLAPSESAERVSDVRQLQAFLLMFDQVLGNQFAQIEQVRLLLGQPGGEWLDPVSQLLEKMLNSANLSDAEQSLFWQSLDKIPHSHITQPVDTINPQTGRGHQLQELPDILGEHLDDYYSPPLQVLTEAPFSRTQLQRLSRAGDHLLARSHEQLPDAAQLRYEEIFCHYSHDLLNHRHAMAGLSADELTQRMALLKEVVDRALFVREIMISGQRGQGSDYSDPRVWGSGNLAGLKQRIYRRLGLSTLTSDVLSTSNTEGFHLVEDTLLRHGITDLDPELKSNVVYLIVPDWPSRLADDDFRQLFRRTVEQELPVHLKPQWLELDRKAMANFEKVYNAWRNALVNLPDDYSDKPQEEQDYRKARAVELSANLREFLIAEGLVDISQWSLDPAAINTGDAVIGQWAIGYEAIDILNYNPDSDSDDGKVSTATIGGGSNPMVIRIAPANDTNGRDH